MQLYKSLFLALVMLFMASCKSNQELAAMNQERAKPIIDAVYAYEADHGSFPKTLNDLVPVYLENLPSTTSGKEFFYSTDELYGFIFSFTLHSGERESYGCGYSDKTGNWECGYGD